jgi:hypothetical protein
MEFFDNIRLLLLKRNAALKRFGGRKNILVGRTNPSWLAECWTALNYAIEKIENR